MTEQTDEDRERAEYERALNDLRAVLENQEGRDFFRYLLKNLGYGELPEIGLEGPLLMDHLGSLRVAQSIFQLISIANPTVAGTMVAITEKEKYARLREQELAERG